jgi:signal transduction histidine kinase
VRDHGIGIPEEEQDRIFERFYRGGAGGEAHKGGSGLGLAMASAIAKAHGATITVDSRPDEGSTFGVLFPSARRMQVVK